VITRLSDGRDSIDIGTTEQISGFVGVREGRQITVTYKRGDETKEVAVTPALGIAPEGAAIGIYMDLVGTLRLPIHKALWEGGIKTYQYTEMTAVGISTFLFGAITGHGDFSQVTGPVGIVNAVGDAAHVGFANLLLFTALISINLAVINIIPFPALDGGRLLFIMIEAIMRKGIKPSVANALNLAGFALLMLLMVVVTWHDVAKLLH
jgi:regulator of sigma E protease